MMNKIAEEQIYFFTGYIKSKNGKFMVDKRQPNANWKEYIERKLQRIKNMKDEPSY